jgi:hypothetical protein
MSSTNEWPEVSFGRVQLRWRTAGKNLPLEANSLEEARARAQTLANVPNDEAEWRLTSTNQGPEPTCEKSLVWQLYDNHGNWTGYAIDWVWTS